MGIKEMVKDQKVHFMFFKDNELWYKTDGEFSFPVPLSEAQGATFLATDKAILFMRYIKNHLMTLEKARADAQH